MLCITENINQTERKSVNNRYRESPWGELILPTSIAGAAGLIGLGGYNYYQAEQKRKQESLEQFRKRILSIPEEKLDDEVSPELERQVSIKKIAYNINDSLKKTQTPQSNIDGAVSNLSNNNIDDDDREIGDLVLATQQL